MREPQPFNIMFDATVKRGTAELYGDRLTIYFHDESDYIRWSRYGDRFKLINHWSRPAPQPKYK